MASKPPYYYMRPGNIVSAAVALSVLDIVVVALRFQTRKIQMQPPKADDWVMIPATLLTVGIGIAQIYGVSAKGLGYRTEIPAAFTGSPHELVTPQLTLKAQLEWAFFLMFPVALGCMKASFIFLYMRVFAIEKHGAVSRFLRGFMIFIFLWTVAFFFAAFFQCGREFWVIWNSEKESLTRCTNRIHMSLALCITDFITDLVIIVIPIPLVLQLNLNTTKKIGICAMFLLGGGTLVASLVRFILLAGTFIGSLDITSDNVLGVTGCMYWGMVECGVGIFAACLPTIQFLIRKSVFEPAVNSARSIFSSRSSVPSELHRGAAHLGRISNNGSYFIVKDSSSCTVSLDNLQVRAADELRVTRDERVGAIMVVKEPWHPGYQN